MRDVHPLARGSGAAGRADRGARARCGAHRGGDQRVGACAGIARARDDCVGGVRRPCRRCFFDGRRCRPFARHGRAFESSGDQRVGTCDGGDCVGGVRRPCRRCFFDGRPCRPFARHGRAFESSGGMAAALRRYAIGAELTDEGVHFRVWAPEHRALSVVIEGGAEVELERDEDGYFSRLVDAKAGARYRFKIGDQLFPDPASRFQPEGPHGPSQVIDPAFAWSEWHGVEPRCFYEMHIGTFTQGGTFAVAAEKLPLLADIGINVIEVMPVNEFAGTFGWGSAGVDCGAPSHLYGPPAAFRRFIDTAHQLGLAVILDVVYNHFGPDGCYLRRFTPLYFTDRKNEWGDELNYEAQGVREFFAENAAYWIDEFHLDGLRLDATQSITDYSVIGEIVKRAHEAAGGRKILIAAENEPQDVALIDVEGVDALWNDDWHHAAMVAMTGRREAYYMDYRGTAQEFVSMAKHGFLYQGQFYAWQKKPRGMPSLHLHPRRFISYLQNHDQIANSARGERMQQLTSPGRVRAMTALLLLQPQLPLLFQGQESGSTKPFLYFADHKPELAEAVAKGRREFLEQFPSLIGRELDSPHARETFEACKLDWEERDESIVDLHRTLLRLRIDDPLIGGAVLNDDAFLLRWPQRLLIVNLGRDLHLEVLDEPLLASPSSSPSPRTAGRGARGEGLGWTLIWSSESPV